MSLTPLNLKTLFRTLYFVPNWLWIDFVSFLPSFVLLGSSHSFKSKIIISIFLCLLRFFSCFRRISFFRRKVDTRANRSTWRWPRHLSSPASCPTTNRFRTFKCRKEKRQVNTWVIWNLTKKPLNFYPQQHKTMFNTWVIWNLTKKPLKLYPQQTMCSKSSWNLSLSLQS